MSAGDFLIRRNASSTAALGNAGANLDALWDTEVIVEGSAATYNAGTFTLTNTAPYLIIYSEQFSTPSTANNTRIEGQGRIRVNGVNIVGGACEGYIRKSNDQQEMVINGMTIYNATAGDTFTTRFYRGDNTNDSNVTRNSNIGGVQILELSSNDDFAQYTTSSAGVLTSTKSSILSWATTQQETGFSRTLQDVTISTAGRYLMVFSGETSQTGTQRLGATVLLQKGTNEVTGVRGYSHMRGSEDNKNGALSFAGIVDVSANDSFSLNAVADNGQLILDAGATWQWWKIPTGNETAVVEATSGNMNSNKTFTWGSVARVDSSGFTANQTAISPLQGTHALAFWNQGQKLISSVQRGYPRGQIAVGGDIVNYSASAVYHRNTSSIGKFAAHGGAVLLTSVSIDSEITLVNSALGNGGSVSVDSGHFSVLKLEGLYKSYTYNFPIGIGSIDGDNIVENSQLNVLITGAFFGETQGSGLVEIGDAFDYSISNKINQPIDSWTDTAIQFDVVVPNNLRDTNAYLFITNDNGTRAVKSLVLGLPPQTYLQALLSISPSVDHLWTFQNTYNDEIQTAVANALAQSGTPQFSTTTIVKGATHSFLIADAGTSIRPENQSDMNTLAANRRYIGGWIMLDKISQTLSVIWEEGASVNNIALLNGFGNNIMFQIADANDDYVQLYVDVTLTPNRPYHFIGNLNGRNYNSGICRAYLDGVEQSRTNGNPWEQSILDTHGGSIAWGGEPGGNLKVGDDRGVDAAVINFPSMDACYYSHWVTWSDVDLVPETDIRVEMFEKGALQQVTIFSDTQVNMQTAIDAQANTVFPDWPCSIEIQKCTDGDFTLTLSNITFKNRVSIQVRYVGQDNLTIVAVAGSLFDPAKLSTPYGGVISVNYPANLNITGIVEGAEVRVYDNNIGSNNLGTELGGIEINPTTTFVYSHAGTTNSVLVQMIAAGFEEIIIPITLTSLNQTLNLIPNIDANA